MTSDVSDDDIALPSYHAPLRNDRKRPKRGGGVGVFIRNDIAYRELAEIEYTPPQIECLWTLLLSFKIVLCSLYVPPNLSSDVLKTINDFIVATADRVLNRFVDCHLIVLGDLNQLPTTDLEHQLDMKQVVLSPTRGNSILDKVLISRTLCDQYNTPIIGPNFGKADHQTVLLVPHEEESYSPSTRKVYDYRRNNIEAFVSTLKNYPWQNFYLSQDCVEKKCEIFYEVIQDALLMIPHTIVQMSPNDKPWMTPILKHLINCRFQAYRAGQFDKYNHYKKKIKRGINDAKASWVTRLKQAKQGIWKAARNTHSRTSNDLVFLLSKYSSPKDVANALNTTFVSVFTPDSLPEDTSFESSRSWTIDITVKAVEELLLRLKPGKSAGIDNLTPRLLKASCSVLAGPITHLFCMSIEACKVPRQWKKALVIPLPKKKNPSLTDFRPISLLPIISKLLERLVLNSVKQDLLKLYGPNQFGFRPGSSTLHAHISMHDFITSQLEIDSTCGVALIAFDLSKAFDRLSHCCLLRTLQNSQLPTNFVRWIRSFLDQRSQRVMFHGSRSDEEAKVTSGVPQGSILAPYLFAAHVGALKPQLEQSLMIKYADDIVILFPFKSTDELADKYQKEFKHIDNWCAFNGLSLNTNKTNLLVFPKTSFASVPENLNLHTNTTLKVLGMFFQDTLKWDKHTEHIVKSASRRIHILRKLKQIPTVTKEDLVQIYHSFILGVLEYNCSVFVGINTKNSKKLEKVRRRCHNIICGFNCQCVLFPSLSSRREAIALRTFAKLTNPDNTLHRLFPPTLPRSKHLYVYPLRTERRAKSFVPFCTNLWNKQL